jgi:hypothetical protein
MVGVALNSLLSAGTEARGACGQIWQPAITRSPAFAKPKAMPRPKPEAAPVMSIVFDMFNLLKANGQIVISPFRIAILIACAVVLTPSR